MWLRKIVDEHTKSSQGVNQDWLQQMNHLVEQEAEQIKFFLDKAASLLKSYYAIMERIEQN